MRKIIFIALTLGCLTATTVRADELVLSVDPETWMQNEDRFGFISRETHATVRIDCTNWTVGRGNTIEISVQGRMHITVWGDSTACAQQAADVFDHIRSGTARKVKITFSSRPQGDGLLLRSIEGVE